MARKLIDLDISEVSVVDKAATGRRFLLEKRENIDPNRYMSPQVPITNPLTPEQRQLTPMPARRVDSEGLTAEERLLAQMTAYVGTWAESHPGKTLEWRDAEVWLYLANHDRRFKEMYAELEAIKLRKRQGYDDVAEAMFAKTATRQTLRDFIWDKMEAIANSFKSDVMKTTKYERISKMMETEEGKRLYALHEDQFARLPMLRAVEKIAKRDGELPDILQKWLKS